MTVSLNPDNKYTVLNETQRKKLGNGKTKFPFQR